MSSLVRSESNAPGRAHAPAPAEPGVRCSTCSMRNICIPSGLDAPTCEKLDAVISVTRRVARGEALFRAGDPFRELYAVRAGSFKTVVTHVDGRVQVTGFDIGGEALGLDGVYTERHTCEAIALEDSLVCVIPFHLLELLCREVKTMQRHVHKMMSGEIVRESGLMLMLGNMRAEERVAAFLLSLSRRMKARGFSASDFQLRMTREDLGSYLGMKIETVSRTFSKLHRQHVIDTHGRHVRILDMDALQRV